MDEKVKNRAFKRGSGVLLHISSLPSKFGIGDFGSGAYRFVDFLSEAKQKYWQVLPLNPTEIIHCNSPYSSNSAFAINDLFVSPEKLVDDGLLDQKDLAALPGFADNRVDYDLVSTFKRKLWDTAYANFKKKGIFKKEFIQFCREHTLWLDDYALFLVIKKQFQGQSWHQWPDPYRRRESKALKTLFKDKEEEIEKIKFKQFLAFTQWLALKNYSKTKKVKIIGDIPIYVTDDSADVWANPGIFKLDEHFQPIYVSGVPPDYFSQTGQRWGTPVYNWETLKADGYRWWFKRIEHNLKLFDLIRIDHFRGLVAYWEIPASEPTAVKGEWIPGPGADFFEELQEEFPQLPIIAEDLGIITPDVTETMNQYGLPGMKVLLFAFGGELSTHPYIPENYSENSVAYTGTHDNNTVRGWIENEASEQEKMNLQNYLGQEIPEMDVPSEFIGMALMSKSDLAIIPLQDLLGLGQDARMNKPGTIEGNWQWRTSESVLTSKLSQRLSRLTVKSKRA